MSHSPIGAVDANVPMAGTAQLLGLSPAQLQFALRAGTTLAQLAAHMGVGTAELIERLHADLDADAQSLSELALDKIATGLDREPPVASADRPRVRIDAYA